MANTPEPSLLEQLSAADRIDALCDQFEHDWTAARNPQIENYLASCNAAERPATLRALLEVELELLQSTGTPPAPEAYLQRFPHDALVVREVFARAAPADAPAMDQNASTLQAADVTTSRVADSNFSLTPPLPDKIGRFQVLKVLGTGAFGTVYRARDPHLEREVAIKLPHNGVLASADDRARFLREAKIAATLNHPHICPVFEVGEVDDHPYIVMALVDGKSLAELIKSGCTITPRQAVNVVRRIALALADAHDQKIVHRDLKPANIMINRRGEPIVMDFGLARIAKPNDARLTHRGQIMGSPAYMSPEQARGATDDVGPASDIYSLGVILYELLCGQRPFRGTVTEVLGQILHVEPPPPSTHQPNLDPTLEAICLKAMAKEPSQRYGSMRGFAAALQTYLKSQAALSAQPPSTSPDLALANTATSQTETPQHQRRQPRWGLVVALMLIVAAAFAAIYRIQTDQGVLVVEVHDPQVEAVLRQDGLTIHDAASGRRYTLRTNGSQTLRSGTYRLAKKQPFRLTLLDDAGLAARVDEFTLRRRDEVRVRVTLEPPPTSADRRVAEWVLQNRGCVDVVLDGTTQTLRPGDQVPKGEFRIEAIGDLPADTVHDNDLSFVRDLKELRRLNLRDQRGVTDTVVSYLADTEPLIALTLQRSQLTDQGLDELTKLPNMQQLEVLEIGGTQISDTGLKSLSHLKRLIKLDLGKTRITDAGLPQLAGLPLKNLFLNDTAITDQGLTALMQSRNLRHLEILQIKGTQVGDAGLASLRHLTRLVQLDLGDTRVTAAGLLHLSDLNRLRHLLLAGNSLGDEGVANLAQLPGLQLTELDLGDAGVTDAGMAHLGGFHSLVQLRLHGNPITDAGLKQLQGLPHLRHLNLFDTQVSTEGVKQLAAVLPNCEIVANVTTSASAAKHSATPPPLLAGLRD